ncbi:2,3-bisphosphoglycerate-independent phosphoglycerate mutase [Patescibacteria group bacterium]|nr:2,3-bisphosphoglycerate-independent phosphoglycerate mutase [Patescibacteria group bacterium]MBU2633387.1 2,3-bisphosphoglycerate-independent phosphoglycerate mutase [Patescibacteria group bacterium]
MKQRKAVALIILDGFGYDKKATESPWQSANTPNFGAIEKYFPFTTIQASGLAVGLPWGEGGNSEVGHLTMGSGRILYNHLPRIIMSIHDGSFSKNEAFLKAVEHVKKNKSRLHLMGLFSSGSVHAYVDHLYALLDLAKENNIEKTNLHLFTDGRDAQMHEGAIFIKQLEYRLEKLYPNARIASVIGRHFAMDRDGRWDNIEKTYGLLTERKGGEFDFTSLYVEGCYKRNITDEFIEPAFNKNAEPIQNGDAVIFFNYREDSARELTSAFIKTGFDEFPRKKIADLEFVTMTQYDTSLPSTVAFLPFKVENPLAKVISLAGMRQVHIAETEKYAHVTYFFNGGKEEPFDGEDRMLVSSPDTSHYDEVPEMSASQITEKIISSIDEYDFILANFANADMVGHTGNFNACIKAIEVLDKSIGEIIPKVLEKNGVAIITADHGNIEEKVYKLTGEKRTKHTTNPVPVYLIGNEWKREVPLKSSEITESYKKIEGMLTDIAPTVLEALGVKAPSEMTGKSLISKLK